MKQYIKYILTTLLVLNLGCKFHTSDQDLWPQDGVVTIRSKHGINEYRFEKGLMVNNKREGIWEYSSENGFVFGEKRFEGGVLNGPFIRYSPKDSSISKISQYKDGKRHGKFVKFYTNGMINEYGYYLNGNSHGKHIIFYKNGVIRHFNNYKHGKREGEQIDFLPNGDTSRVRIYKEGQLINERKID